MSDFIFCNQDEKLKFSAENGRLLSFSDGAVELLTASEQAFVLRFLQKDGSFLDLTELDFNSLQKTGNQLVWENCPAFPSIQFSLEIKKGDPGAGFRFYPEVSGIPENLNLVFCEPVRVTVPYEDQLMIPWLEGYIPSRNMKKLRPVHHWDYSCYGSTMTYPGGMQMQFLFASNGKAGLYFAADDYSHLPKVLEFHADKPEEKIGFRVELTAGESYGKRNFTSPCELVLRRTGPDWREACELYRKWVKQDSAMQENFPHPAWMKEPLTVITYPVCGDRNLSPELNNFYPYENFLPRIEELAEQFGTRVMVLLMRWDHNGPWLPPFYWPPAGGADSFRRLRDGLHAKGNLFAVYGSGTCYTMKSKFSDYSGEEYYKEHDLGKSMVRGPKGERTVNCCSFLRTSEAFCLAENAGREILTEQALILAKEKVDYFQMFDQNLGGDMFPCYAKDHHHLPVPGLWQYEAMRSFLDDLNSRIRNTGSQMILGTEAAAAGPFLSGMPFNDLRYNLNFFNGTPVPAYAYVFHAYANNFLGNQCLMDRVIDSGKCPENLQYRLAYGFSIGAVLTVTLRDSGEIDWGGGADWTKPAPAQEPAIRLIRELNMIRKKYPQYLMHGEMCLPRYQLECGIYEIELSNKDSEPVHAPSILHSAWRSPEGKQAEFFVNYLNREQKLKIDGKEFSLAPLSVLTLEK